jgi:hypothetical protein
MFSYLRRRAAVKGLLGGSRSWLVVWVVLFGLRLLRRITHQKEKVVFSEELKPGQTLVISASDREPKVIGA